MSPGNVPSCQHQNIKFFFQISSTASATQDVQFIASTCDFSDDVAGQLPSTFEGKPKCKDNTGKNGIIINLPSSTTEVTYSIIVWTYIKKCGKVNFFNADNEENIHNVLDTNSPADRKTNITFDIKLDSGNLAVSSGLKVAQDCYSNYSDSITQNKDNTSYSSLED